MTRYLIIIEETSTGFAAYSPDLPGCVATGSTHEEIKREMHGAIEFHLEGLRLAGEPIPEPRSQASWCEIAAYFSRGRASFPEVGVQNESRTYTDGVRVSTAAAMRGNEGRSRGSRLVGNSRMASWRPEGFCW